MSNKDLKVPNIGDFKDVEVIEVLVNEGDNITKNDPLITIESDKSSVEIPSIYSGKIEKLNLKVGDKVSEGSSIATISAKDEIDENIKEDKKLENKKETISQPENNKIEIEEKKPGSIKLASPKARKFARELCIDVSEISGSERLGRVVESDIKKFAATKINNPNEIQKEKTEKKIQIQYSHSEFGEVEVKDIPRIKRIAAPHLVNSWSSIPHVTNHDEADITEMEEFRNSLTDIYSGQSKKITPLAFIIKALVTSLKNFPNFNSSIAVSYTHLRAHET